ncbi:hypothetical protein PPGU19_088720 (plasmid) [Paraburkholderia sp. PGU19]|uniref:hypothetical protein n=1 Tax=Paraburkholderia sp. PGU19 TaxID=2735434 RepID=UPI0015D96997|nr:hypothetical protein [Paraburkholderia sp. PGU19]BCG04304.1 hypothetical protein PPGU19_088720 [Paraburkholderia sp. PGU19]
MLKEVLPLDKGISSSGIRDRILDLGNQLDADIERDIAQLPGCVADDQVRESSHVASVSVDSAWLRNCDFRTDASCHVNIVAGRATFKDGPPKLYAYVHKEVTSAAARLDQFLSRNGEAIDERVTVISDDGGEFAKTIEGSKLARGRILDWFHIAMKFRAAQRSVFGSNVIDSMERESVEDEINHAKWLVWHGKGSKALERIKALDSRLLAREGYEFKTLWWNLNNVSIT